jgi:glycosyltransferase involved in cell wall biosynthesis
VSPGLDASVIVPALDAAATLPAQLDALCEQDFVGAFEIIVADNGSKDSTPAVVAEPRTKGPEIRLVDASDARGAGHARNVGAGAARATKFLFCDADDLVARSWCRSLVAALDRHDAAGGAIDFARLNPSLPGVSAESPLAKGLDRWPEYLPFAWAGNLGVRADVFRSVGGFDTSFTGCDDQDLSFRIQQQGHSLGFADEAVLHCRVSPSARVRARLAYRYAIDEPHLYREHRDRGMPRGTPASRWLGGIASRTVKVLRHPTNPGARQIARESLARFRGMLVGSAKYGTWFLGPR